MIHINPALDGRDSIRPRFRRVFSHIEVLTARGESRTGEKNGGCHQFAPVSVPDGRLLALTAGKQEAEVWVMGKLPAGTGSREA